MPEETFDPLLEASSGSGSATTGGHGTAVGSVISKPRVGRSVRRSLGCGIAALLLSACGAAPQHHATAGSVVEHVAPTTVGAPAPDIVAHLSVGGFEVDVPRPPAELDPTVHDFTLPGLESEVKAVSFEAPPSWHGESLGSLIVALYKSDSLREPLTRSRQEGLRAAMGGQEGEFTTIGGRETLHDPRAEVMSGASLGVPDRVIGRYAFAVADNAIVEVVADWIDGPAIQQWLATLTVRPA